MTYLLNSFFIILIFTKKIIKVKLKMFNIKPNQIKISVTINNSIRLESHDTFLLNVIWCDTMTPHTIVINKTHLFK